MNSDSCIKNNKNLKPSAIFFIDDMMKLIDTKLNKNDNKENNKIIKLDKTDKEPFFNTRFSSKNDTNQQKENTPKPRVIQTNKNSNHISLIFQKNGNLKSGNRESKSQHQIISNCIYLKKRVTSESPIKSYINRPRSNVNYFKFNYKISTNEAIYTNSSDSNPMKKSLKLNDIGEKIINRKCISPNFTQNGTDNTFKTRIPIKLNSNLPSKGELIYARYSNRNCETNQNIHESKFVYFLKKLSNFNDEKPSVKRRTTTIVKKVDSTKVIENDYDVTFKFMKKTDIQNRVYIKKHNYSSRYKNDLKFSDEESPNNLEASIF
jgi:hypothetical protein